MKKILIGAIVLFCAAALSSCGVLPKKNSGVYNELGKVMVIEYHRIGDGTTDYDRSAEKFRADLQRFYDAGYRLISLRSFFNGSRVDLPAGKKPMIMVFDDSHPSHFKFLIKDGATVEGSGGFPKIDPDCAVGILDEFSRRHGDFGKSVTFFCNSQIFYQRECPELWPLKLQYLVKTGREIGNHTYNHERLDKLDYIGIKRELATLHAKIQSIIPSYEVNSVALPFGILPKKGKWLLQDGSYGGTTYKYKVAFLVGAGPALPPYHKDFIPYMAQRIQAMDSELDKWLGRAERYPQDYFVSDGDADGISVQQQDMEKIDLTQVPAGMRVKVCSGESVVKEVRIPKKKDRISRLRTADKGVYYTFHSAGIQSRIDSLIESYKRTGLNTIVVDIKDVEGTIGASLDVKLAKDTGANDRIFIKDLKGLVAKLKQEGIRVSARVTCFKDMHLARRRPDLAMKLNSGGTYLEGGAANWVDPFNPVVQDYILDISEETAKAGVDEIQFDYIRFPEKRSSENIRTPENMDKYMAIESFLRAAHQRLDKYGVSIAIDVFGVMAWLKDVDIATTGQRIGEMAKYVDVICPMLYPSHFDSGFDGHPDPANDPYTFIKRGCEKTAKLIEGSNAKIVPWIQGFEYRVKDFNEKYVQDQIRAAKDCGINSYLVWNAGNRYSVTYRAITSEASSK